MAKPSVDVATVLAALKRAGTAKQRESMARYGIVAPNAYGVSVATIQKLAKSYGKNHALAAALWDSGIYEARMIVRDLQRPVVARKLAKLATAR